MREFTLAEIEHFMDPEEDIHPKFKQVENVELLLFPRDNQTTSGDLLVLAFISIYVLKRKDDQNDSG